MLAPFRHGSLLPDLLCQPLGHLGEAFVVGVDGDGIEEGGVVVDQIGAFHEMQVGIVSGCYDFTEHFAVALEAGDLALGVS